MRRFLPVPGWNPGYLHVCPSHLIIQVRCAGCGDEKELDRNALPRSLEHALITDIERRLKCSACGAKKARMMFGSYVDGDEAQR